MILFYHVVGTSILRPRQDQHQIPFPRRAQAREAPARSGSSGFSDLHLFDFSKLLHNFGIGQMADRINARDLDLSFAVEPYAAQRE